MRSRTNREQRNINGHKPSRIAQILWNKRYAAHAGGLMDFWDSLSISERNQCRDILRSIQKARNEELSEAFKGDKLHL